MAFSSLFIEKLVLNSRERKVADKRYIWNVSGLTAFRLWPSFFSPIAEQKSSDQGFSQPFCCGALFSIATLLQ
ncbi:hypothetical protein [Cohaesibacter marisflavi]|uniref:hypothetical protein n=1 Tax=Cohaesibacter marisflavi TaxID=655353 RepID=UPI000B7E16BA|nr:hypothetical protein [Cohaesibacter marisflavi]